MVDVPGPGGRVCGLSSLCAVHLPVVPGTLAALGSGHRSVSGSYSHFVLFGVVRPQLMLSFIPEARKAQALSVAVLMASIFDGALADRHCVLPLNSIHTSQVAAVCPNIAK